MDFIVLLVLVYLTSGEPIVAKFHLQSNHPCDAAVAVDYVRQFVVPELPPGAEIQDPIATGRHLCVYTPSVEPGPAWKMEPVLQEGQTDA
jgi:hypothetical protein